MSLKRDYLETQLRRLAETKVKVMCRITFSERARVVQQADIDEIVAEEIRVRAALEAGDEPEA